MENVMSIAEFVSAMYPEGEKVPQELLESCEVLVEATKRDVQLKVYFQQAFDALRKKKWTVDNIDKEIKKIEKCNKYIEEAQSKFILSPKYLKLVTSKTYWESVLKHGCYAVAYIGINTIIMNSILGILIRLFGIRNWGDVVTLGIAKVGTTYGAASYHIADRVFSMKDNGSGKHLVAYEKLHKENEKALKWLKEERDRIINSTAKKKKLSDIITGKQESGNIFDSIELM